MTASDEPVAQSMPPSADIVPPGSQGIVSLPESLANGIPVIGFAQPVTPEEVPKGSNPSDVVIFAIDSRERTDNLLRIIYAVTLLTALVLGLISAAALVILHYRLLGEIGLASATVAALTTTKLWYSQRHKQAGR